jgi:hypothetical protein
MERQISPDLHNMLVLLAIVLLLLWTVRIAIITKDFQLLRIAWSQRNVRVLAGLSRGLATVRANVDEFMRIFAPLSQQSMKFTRVPRIECPSLIETSSFQLIDSQGLVKMSFVIRSSTRIHVNAFFGIHKLAWNDAWFIRNQQSSSDPEELSKLEIRRSNYLQLRDRVSASDSTRELSRKPVSCPPRGPLSADYWHRFSSFRKTTSMYALA